MSKINWTDQTLNLTSGCTKVSAGCKNCYAETMHKRLTAMGQPKYSKPFNQMVEHWNLLEECLTENKLRGKPKAYFVNSMSDLFHENISPGFIFWCLTIPDKYHQHKFIYLTKRPDRMKEAWRDLMKFNKFQVDEFEYPKNFYIENIWLGVTVENQVEGIPRLKQLQKIDHPNKFLSCEPLLEDLGELDLTGIKGVIVGGESGHKARAMHPRWAENIRIQCQVQGVKFWFKQWGKWKYDSMWGKPRKTKSKNDNEKFGQVKYQPTDFWE